VADHSSASRRSPQHRPPVAAGRCWLARLALAAVLGAVLLLAAGAGWRGIPLLLLVVGHAAVALAGLWLVLARRGVVRMLGVLVTVAAVAVTVLLEIRSGLLWTVAGTGGLLAVGWAAGRAAVRAPVAGGQPPAPPPRRPFLVMNPRSGGGTVLRYGLQARAEALGAEVLMLAGPEPVDVAAAARAAVGRGADLLGVAGGDGTQALVAGVAADSGVPLLVVPAGTRNHFALDLGLDRTDPVGCLAALRDGVELRVDLGEVAGRPFVNNVSFGAYAELVRRPEYRAEKARTTARLLPDLLAGRGRERLLARAGSRTITGPQALLVSNNPYGTGDIAGLGRRSRLDGGRLGVVGVRVANAAQAAALLRGRRPASLTVLAAADVVVDADRRCVPAGIDGESVLLGTPVRCRIRPGALRVRVPPDRPGVPLARLRLSTLTRLARQRPPAAP
jgi:diacylglycerol kinase family enzyme